jgi:hypothetical protein
VPERKHQVVGAEIAVENFDLDAVMVAAEIVGHSGGPPGGHCRKSARRRAAIDGSKFKAVNTRDKNFTRNKVERRRAQLEESVARYLSQLDTADRQEPTEALGVKVARLKEK